MRRIIRRFTTARYYSQIFDENSKNIEDLLDILADERSRTTFIGILKAYTSFFRKPYYYFSNIADSMCKNFHFSAEDGYKVYGTENPYFLKEIFSLDKDMVYLDGGAYIGDTIELLFKVLNGPCKYTYAFEPNDVNFRKIEKLSEKYTDYIACFNAGLDNHTGIVSFVKDDAGSRIIESGAEKIEVIDVGEFLNNLTNNLPTFIKLDIEGKESDVIDSMSIYIKKNSPDLAISIYHKLEDLWQIPLQIHKINPDYKIYIRHQSNYYTETVCYATVKDREN